MSEQSDSKWQRLPVRKMKTNKPGYKDFRSQASKRLEAITEAQGSLQCAYELLSNEEDIWPDQCDFAIDSIQTIVEPVQDFCTLLAKAAEIPLSVVPLRPELLMKLYFVNDQVQKLTHMLRTFRSTCQDPSKQVQKQRSDIYRTFELLLQEGEAITQSKFLLYNACSQEHEYVDVGGA
jgi:hypothetical protein